MGANSPDNLLVLRAAAKFAIEGSNCPGAEHAGRQHACATRSRIWTLPPERRSPTRRGHYRFQRAGSETGAPLREGCPAEGARRLRRFSVRNRRGLGFFERSLGYRTLKRRKRRAPVDHSAAVQNGYLPWTLPPERRSPTRRGHYRFQRAGSETGAPLREG